MRFTFRLLAAAAAVALSVGAANAAPINIDNFTSYNSVPGATGVQSTNTPNTYSNWIQRPSGVGERGFETAAGFTLPATMTITETGLSGVLGGQRKSTIEFTSLTSPSNGQQVRGVMDTSGPGVLSFNQDNLANGKLTLQYNFAATNFATHAGLAIDFLNIEAGTTTITVTITDGGSSTSSQTLNIPPPGTGPFTLFLPFTGFTGTANLATLTSISFVIDGSTSQDFGINNLYAYEVPEPMSLTVFGVLAIGGVAAVARRKLLARKSVASAA